MTAMAVATARLDLVPTSAADLADIVALHRDPRVTKHLLDGIPDEPWKVTIYLDWAAGLHARRIGPWTVRRRDDARFLGLFTLTPSVDGDDDLLEFGGRLARGGWPGDLGVEAGAGLIGHAFDALARDEIVSVYHPGNPTVPTALARLGFTGPRPVTMFGREGIEVRLTATAWRNQGNAPRPRSSRSAARAGYVHPPEPANDVPSEARP